MTPIATASPGAMLTTGVTLRITAAGMTARSTKGIWVMATARPNATTKLDPRPMPLS